MKIQARMIQVMQQSAEMRAHMAKLEEEKKLAHARLAVSENQRLQLEAENENLRQTARLHQVRLVEQQERIADLLARIARLEGRAPGPRPRPAAKIQASIVALDAKKQIAEIDAGADKGVQKGMRLLIYRGENFVGYLVIQVVAEKSAAGMVLQKQLDPKTGDKITNAGD